MTARQVRVPARIGLLGNPSDGYGGRVIAAAIDDCAATVYSRPTTEWEVHGAYGTTTASDSIERYRHHLDELTGGAELLAATLLRLAKHPDWPATAQPHRLAFSTTIPRQAGLAGSSAIVIGALRLLSPLLGRPVGAAELARLALDVETEVLGWSAGPQDRVIQTHGGVLDMDFSGGWHRPRWRRVSPAALPPLVVAWRAERRAASHRVHRDVAARHVSGDADVVAAMQSFAALAAAGSMSLTDRTADGVWGSLFAEAWRLRNELWTMSDGDHQLVDLANEHGLAATVAGSGGAIVATPCDGGGPRGGPSDSNSAGAAINRFLAAAAADGAVAIRPTISPSIATPPDPQPDPLPDPRPGTGPT